MMTKRIFQPLYIFHLLFFNFICSDVLIQKWLDVRLNFFLNFSMQHMIFFFWIYYDNTLSNFVFHVFPFFSAFPHTNLMKFFISLTLPDTTVFVLLWLECAVLFFIFISFIIWIDTLKSDENDEIEFCQGDNNMMGNFYLLQSKIRISRTQEAGNWLKVHSCF